MPFKGAGHFISDISIASVSRHTQSISGYFMFSQPLVSDVSNSNVRIIVMVKSIITKTTNHNNKLEPRKSSEFPWIFTSKSRFFLPEILRFPLRIQKYTMRGRGSNECQWNTETIDYLLIEERWTSTSTDCTVHMTTQSNTPPGSCLKHLLSKTYCTHNFLSELV